LEVNKWEDKENEQKKKDEEENIEYEGKSCR